jgi:hypothetical protein
MEPGACRGLSITVGLMQSMVEVGGSLESCAEFGYKDVGSRLRRAHIESSLATQMPWLCVSAPLGCLTSRPLGRRWAEGLRLAAAGPRAAAGPPSRFARGNRLSFVDFPPGRAVSRPARVARFGR